MQVRSLKVLASAGMAVVALTSVSAASAQGLSPMRAEVKSFSDQFAVRVFPMNPYEQRIKVQIKVYDDTFQPVAANVIPAEAILASQDSRSVMVVVPFEGASQRRVRICAESIPFATATTKLRTQVCGKFFAQRLQ